MTKCLFSANDLHDVPEWALHLRLCCVRARYKRVVRVVTCMSRRVEPTRATRYVTTFPSVCQNSWARQRVVSW